MNLKRGAFLYLGSKNNSTKPHASARLQCLLHCIPCIQKFGLNTSLFTELPSNLPHVETSAVIFNGSDMWAPQITEGGKGGGDNSAAR